jgi:NTE family protein
MSIFNIQLFGKKGIGLALGGGGVRGFFHVGVLNALRDNKVKINKISGTSIGAIVGALYTADPAIDFENIFGELNFLKVSALIASTYSKNKTTDLEKFLQTYIKAKSFEGLKIPLSFCATDLNNKKEVIFTTGELFPALLASFAIPGIFPPVEYDGNFLVDGGVVNTVPASHLENESKLVISDITGPVKIIDEKTSNIDVLNTSLAVAQQKNSLNLLEAQNYSKKKLIHLQLEDTSTFVLDFRKQNYRRLIDLGYKAVQDALPSIID